MDKMQEARRVMSCINNIWLFYILVDVSILMFVVFMEMETTYKTAFLLMLWGIFQFSFSNWERKVERVYKKKYSIYIPESES